LQLLNDSVNRAFSKQSIHYDRDDEDNVILQSLRKQVYAHVDQFLKPASRILELNAGTGIDAVHFVSQGHSVHAIDIAEGMITQLEGKIRKLQLEERLTCEQLSYTELGKIHHQKFDHVFSNFGGLNCIDDLSIVATQLNRLLKPGGYVTWVIMPPLSAWELLSVLKGSSNAFRRLQKKGILAHLEGEHFQTFYHSPSKTKKAFGSNFSLRKAEGLAALSPPPHRGDIPIKYPRVYKYLVRIDTMLRYSFPFNRCADHLILTFRLNP
jgi:ubiquinone/menaquinone biosynthesis C-methylase UbiE